MVFLNLLLMCLSCFLNFGNVHRYDQHQSYENQVEEKSKKNYFMDFGYVVFCLDDFCRGDFINRIVDSYSPASVIYQPPYVNFSFTIYGSLFNDVRYVTRNNINSSDYGYSTGSSAPNFTYTCIRVNTSVGTNTFYSSWAVSNDYNSDVAYVNLFSYSSTSFESYLYLWEISSSDVNGVYVSPVSRAGQPNLYELLFSSSSSDEYQVGYSDGYFDGEWKGYQVGYSDGVIYSESQDSTALTIFTGFVNVGLLPVNVFLKMFDYEVFGINIAGLITSLITIAITIIIIRIITGKKND